LQRLKIVSVSVRVRPGALDLQKRALSPWILARLVVDLSSLTRTACIELLLRCYLRDMANHAITPGTLGAVRTKKRPDGQWWAQVMVVDPELNADGTHDKPRRTRVRPTKAAAIEAAKRAAQQTLLDLQAVRQARAKAEAVADLGDLTTTVGDLVESVMLDSVGKLKAGTISNYRSQAKFIQSHSIAGLLPRQLDVAGVRRFLREHAEQHGSSAAQQAKALLVKALNIAVESQAMMTAFNPVAAAKRAIPKTTVRESSLDHGRTPDDETVYAMLAALRADPAYGPMTGPRTKSPHGAAGTATPNPTDVADLLTVIYGTGARIGEVSALRWTDLHLGEDPYIEITGTVRFVSKAAAMAAGLDQSGTQRQESTKTKGSDRNVPILPELAQQLRERAGTLGIDLEDAEHLRLPVFPSPQKPERFRDQRNLADAIKAAQAAHGIDYAATHVARKWRITNLADKGIPISKVADLVGHARVEQTLGYMGRGRQMDSDVRAAL